MSDQVPFASRAALLQPSPRRYGDAVLPVLGCRIRYQSLTELEKSQYELQFFDAKGKRVDGRTVDCKARLIVLCAVDESGAKLFQESDAPLIQQWDGKDTTYLNDLLWEHCGFGGAKTEDIAKN